MSRTFQTCLVLAIAVAVLHALSFSTSGPIDDDFICFRYARHLLQGDGLVFNPGERIEGFTAPLWVLVIGAGLALGLNPVTLSLTFSALACGLAAWAVGSAWRTLRPESSWPIPALLVATSPALAFHGAAGLGTTLLAALLVTWLALGLRAQARQGSLWGAGIALALACLLRQEAALFAIPFFFGPGRRRGAAWLPLAALALWTCLRWVYYGGLLPMTYTVKKLPVAEDLARGFDYFMLSTLVAGVGVYLLVAVLGHLRSNRESSWLRCAIVGLVLHTAYVIWVGGDYVALARFFVPTLPLAMLMACLGWTHALGGGRGLACMALTAAMLLPQALQVKLDQRIVAAFPQASILDDHCRPYLALLHEFDEQRWESLGRYFGEVVPADRTVALSPIGAFGWYSELKIVDVLGLTNTSAARREPDLSVALKGHHRSDGAWVLSQEPDYVILGNGVRDHEGRLVVNPWEKDLVNDERFPKEYLRESVPIPGGADLDLYRRRSAPPLPGARSAR